MTTTRKWNAIKTILSLGEVLLMFLISYITIQVVKNILALLYLLISVGVLAIVRYIHGYMEGLDSTMDSVKWKKYFEKQQNLSQASLFEEKTKNKK